jgi:hypothetical protein
MTISSVGDYIQAIKDLQNRPSKVGRNDGPRVGRMFDSWYRGQRSSSWSLQPKVYRETSRTRYNERDLTNRFRVLSKSRHSITPDYDNYGLFLSLMQHYGLPTRLLDWSTSPLVALYFAIEDYIYSPDTQPTEATIWVLDPYLSNYLQTRDSSTPSIEGWSVRKYLRSAFTDFKPKRADENFKEYLPAGRKKVYAVMSAENDSRIFAQQGCFTVHTTGSPFEDFANSAAFLDRIDLPSNSVDRIADEMVICGFRKSTMFPDLTNLARDLSARYE